MTYKQLVCDNCGFGGFVTKSGQIMVHCDRWQMTVEIDTDVRSCGEWKEEIRGRKDEGRGRRDEVGGMRL